MHSPYFTNLRYHLHEALEKADHKIWVAVAWFTDRETASLLVQKARKGVQIQVFIVDDEINQRLDTSEVESAGIQITRIPKIEGLLHFKFCIIDDHTVVYGSANWTFSAFTHNQEQITVVEDDMVFIERFQDEFRQLQKRFAPPKTSTTGLQSHPERTFLQGEIRLLEAVLAETETEIAEATSLLKRFERLYKRYLGSLLSEILRLRVIVAQLKANLTQKLEDQQEAEQQQQEYESFSEAEESAQELSDLDLKQSKTPEEKQGLHRMFREAVKLCHPDKVEEQFRKAAQAVFVKLKEAFDAQNFEAVQQILEELKAGIAWQIPPEQITDIEVLRKLRDKYKQQLLEKQAILQSLLQSPSYMEVSTAESWETLIEQERSKLEYERSRLQEEVKKLDLQ